MGWCCYCHSPAYNGPHDWHDTCRGEAVRRRETGRCLACGEAASTFHGTCARCTRTGGIYRNYPGGE